MITDNYCLEQVDGVYYHRILDEHIEAYKTLGTIRLCVPVFNKVSIRRPVDLTGVGVRKINKENTIRTRFLDRRENKRIISEEVRNADIVVGFVPSPVCDLAQKYAAKYKKKFVSVVIASAWDILWHHSNKGKVMAVFSHFGTRRTIWNSDYAIYVTEKYLQSKYPTQGISVAISDAVIENHDTATLDRRIAAIRSKADQKRLNLMSIGAVDVRYKGHEEVIEAIPSLLKDGFDVNYYLIGAGSDAYLKTVAQRSGVESRVHFVGGLPHEKIFERFEDIDIYIQPSRTEGLPRSVVEAMSCAVPVICSRIGGMPELVPEDCIYTSGNICELVDCIRRMAESPETLCRNAELNFQNASNFRKEHLAAKREDFLKNVILKNGL